MAEPSDPYPYDGGEEHPEFARFEFSNAFHIVGEGQTNVKEFDPFETPLQQRLDHNGLPPERRWGLADNEDS